MNTRIESHTWQWGRFSLEDIPRRSVEVSFPPLPEGNEDRAQRAAVAMHAHQRYQQTEDLPNPTDLLADLMHYCAGQGLSFERELRVAREHFKEESEGGGS